MSTGFPNITEVKRANKAHGHYWFSPETVKAFNARVETPIIGGHYWVESLNNYDGTTREYMAVSVDSLGGIGYLHGAERFPTLAEARAIIDAIVNNREVSAK